MQFRKLKAEEIDVKVGSVTSKGYTLLLYKNARVDMAILDETVGAENWQNKFYEVCGNLYCSVGININFNNKEKEIVWVWKDDCGVESAFGDKEKGQASDARKRAGFAWGIGRELYTAPFIFVSCETQYDEKSKSYKIVDQNEKFRKFNVKEITYMDCGDIDKLVIVDNKGVVAFNNSGKQPIQPTKTTEEKKQSQHSGLKCEDCDENITDKVAKYSQDVYGKYLCFDCQRKHKPKDVEVS